jgi:predicted nucleic acid-binding protein
MDGRQAAAGGRGAKGLSVRKLVWDSSAIVSFKEAGYGPAYWLWKDLKDGWISDKYENIIPAIAAFEYIHAINRKRHEHKNVLSDLYIIGDYERIYPIDQELIQKSAPFLELSGFDKLRGADLIFACIAKVENAMLVTLDNHFLNVAAQIEVLNLSGTSGRSGYQQMFNWRRMDDPP